MDINASWPRIYVHGRRVLYTRERVQVRVCARAIRKLRIRCGNTAGLSRRKWIVDESTALTFVIYRRRRRGKLGFRYFRLGRPTEPTRKRRQSLAGYPQTEMSKRRGTRGRSRGKPEAAFGFAGWPPRQELARLSIENRSAGRIQRWDVPIQVRRKFSREPPCPRQTTVIAFKPSWAFGLAKGAGNT